MSPELQRKKLQSGLVEITGCAVQHDGWPCNTCFHSLELEGVTPKRLHEFWEAVLGYRGDYTPKEVGQSPTRIKANIEALNALLVKAEFVN